MKKFYLLELYPTGGYNQSGNIILSEHTCPTIKEAITYFKSIYPELNLDEFGYTKEGDKSFTVAEQFNPFSYHPNG